MNTNRFRAFLVLATSLISSCSHPKALLLYERIVLQESSRDSSTVEFNKDYLDQLFVRLQEHLDFKNLYSVLLVKEGFHHLRDVFQRLPKRATTECKVRYEKRSVSAGRHRLGQMILHGSQPNDGRVVPGLSDRICRLAETQDHHSSRIDHANRP